MDTQLLLICFLTFVIHLIGTLAAQALLVPAAVLIASVARVI